MRSLRRVLPWSGATVLGLWLALVFTALSLWREDRGAPIPFLDEVEDAILGWKFQARGLLRPGGDVVIAAVDERSVQRFGRWPWSRDRFALLVERLRSYGARTVAFDVLFDERDREGLDARFAEAIRKAANVVLGFFLFESAGDAPGASPEDLLAGLAFVAEGAARAVKDDAAERGEALAQAVGARAPIEVLARAAGKWMGYFNARPETHGRSVGLRLATEIDGRFLFHFALVAVSHFLGFDATLRFREGEPPRLVIADLLIPTEIYGRFYPNYYGPRNTFKHFSVADIVDGRVPTDRLQGKLVFVGATAIALPDTWRTPFDSALPGVEIHATAADNMLTRRFLQRPLEVTVAEVALLVLIGPLLGFALSRARLAAGALVALGVLLGTGLGDYLLFREGVLMRSALLYSEIVTVVLASYVLLYFRVYKERKHLRNTMRHYLAPSVLEEILRDQRKLKLGGEKRELTVLLSDIRGFTRLAEALDARDLAAFLNEYFTPMTDIVLAHLGTFDKYMGDALMAFFGAPQEMPDHAARACRAALDMRAELERLNAGWRARGRPTIQIGVGLSTGTAAFGNMGSARLFSYTVIGDHVNLASRLETTCKIFGASIAVSEATARAAAEEHVFRRLGRVHVAGKAEPIDVLELVARRESGSALEPWLRAFAEALACFEARDLDGAEAGFRAALAQHADPVAEAYLARIAEARSSAGWEVAWRAGK